MLIPIRTSSLYNQTPYANWTVMIMTIAVSFAAFSALAQGHSVPEPVRSMILEGWDIKGIFGHVLLHGGILHLAGNMIFLWVFGNTVCAKTGSLLYIPVYLLCGLGAATVHNLMSGAPTIGASGAINGIVGLYLVLQPVNDVEMLFLLGWRGVRFTIAGYWVILYWAAWDIFGVFSGAQEATHVAYAAHVGGLLTGIALGIILVLLKLVTMDEYDNPTLPEYLKWVPMGYSDGYYRGETTVHDEQPQPSFATAAAQEPIPTRLPPIPVDPEPEPTRASVPFAPRTHTPPAVETDPETIAFQCPHCDASLEMEGQTGAVKISCPSCNGHITLEFDDDH